MSLSFPMCTGCLDRSRERMRDGVRCLWLGFLVSILLLANGVGAVRGQEVEIPNDYGGRFRGNSRVSLNGIGGFAELFERRGYVVDTAYRLSPKTHYYGTIVWCPDESQPIRQEVRDYLDDWLTYSGVTLVIVGHDYDGTIDYLDELMSTSTGAELERYERVRASAVSQRHVDRLEYLESESEWVNWKPSTQFGTASTISGRMVAGVNLADAHVVHGMYPEAKPNEGYDMETLMSIDGEPFVVELVDEAWWDGRILIVSNGSFLLNYGLTYPGNVRIAESLIDEIDPSYDVLFLESDASGIEVRDNDQADQQTLWDWVKIWPFKFFVPHFIVLGVLFYFVVLPIFGRPRTIEPPSSSDFSQHVEALGALMERTHDKGYAIKQLQHYQDQVRHESSGIGARRKPT